MEKTTDIAVKSRNVGLAEVLDRVLDKGVVVDGDVYLCVAGIELVYLKLKLLLASTATVEKFTPTPKFSHQDATDSDIHAPLPPRQESPAIYSGDKCGEKKYSLHKAKCVNTGCEGSPSSSAVQELMSPNASALNTRVLRDDEAPPLFDKPRSGKIDIDPKKVEQGLAKLVLTLVELLRNLMEKQALRRMKLGTLKDKEIDKLGEAFMLLDRKMKELKNVFGLEDGDLNLDLGPLGDLI